MWSSLSYCSKNLQRLPFNETILGRLYCTSPTFHTPNLGLTFRNSSRPDKPLQSRRGFFYEDGKTRHFIGLANVQRVFSSTMPSIAEEFRHLDYTQLTEKLKSNDKYILIDVRENSELAETGTIPGACHIPVGEIETALLKSGDDFQKAYNFPKPTEDAEIIFSCRSGKRSLMALEKALTKGFINSKHYKGGWLDWESNTTS